MSKPIPPYAKIISALNVEDEALKAFYVSLMTHQSVDEYIHAHHIHFCSRQVEGCFLNHVLALTELALETPTMG